MMIEWISFIEFNGSKKNLKKTIQETKAYTIPKGCMPSAFKNCSFTNFIDKWEPISNSTPERIDKDGFCIACGSKMKEVPTGMWSTYKVCPECDF